MEGQGTAKQFLGAKEAKEAKKAKEAKEANNGGCVSGKGGPCTPYPLREGTAVGLGEPWSWPRRVKEEAQHQVASQHHNTLYPAGDDELPPLRGVAYEYSGPCPP